MRLNFGDFRNVAHLHLKIFVKKHQFRNSAAWKKYCKTTTCRIEGQMMHAFEQAQAKGGPPQPSSVDDDDLDEKEKKD